MNLFDVPSQDVLFTHVFSNLRLLDIWKLRLISKEFYCLCWDYFMNVCNALSVTLQLPHSQDGTALGVAASISILGKCKKIRCLAVNQEGQGVSEFLEKLLCEVIRNEHIVLKEVCFRGVNFCGVTPELINCLSIKFHELRELELCSVLVRGIPIDTIIAKFIEHCKPCLLKLSMTNLVSPLSKPLSLDPLTSLKHLSVANCHRVSPEGCLEELLRKCPSLEVVDLCQVKSVSNRTLLVLTEYCSNLQHLFVEGCTLVTMEMLVKMHVERGVNIDVKLLENTNKCTRTPGQI